MVFDKCSELNFKKKTDKTYSENRFSSCMLLITGATGHTFLLLVDSSDVYVDDLTSLSDANRNVFITVYADDIFLLSPSVTALQHLFCQCELEFKYLDMTVNPTKTHCVRIDSRCSVNCADNVKLILFLGSDTGEFLLSVRAMQMHSRLCQTLVL